MASFTYKQVRFVNRAAGILGVDLGVVPCDYESETQTFSGQNVPVKAHLSAATEIVAGWRNHPINPTESCNRVARWMAFGDALLAASFGGDIGAALKYFKAVENRGNMTAAAKAQGFIERLGLVGVATGPAAPVKPVQVARPVQVAKPPQLGAVPQDKMQIALQLALQGWTKVSIEALLGIELP